MAFNKKVLKLLKEKRKSKAELAKAAGIPYTTLDSMLKRDSDTTRLQTIYKIADYLGVRVEELVFDDFERNAKKTLSEREEKLVEGFRLVDERAKNTVFSLLSYEMSSQRAKEKSEEKRRIPIYLSPAAAGEPLPMIDDDYSLVNSSSAPENASFGIKIMGDSMEPLIHDGSVVWVERCERVENGEIGIFTLNAESVCKKLVLSSGKCTLVSLNPKYRPIEVFETDELRVVGKVLI